jgi:nucleotide-binding universal stress UspA family protein
MRILIAYDGSAYADAAIEDLRFAGLPPENGVQIISVAHAGWTPSKEPRLERAPFSSPWKTCMREAEAFAEQARAHVQFQFPSWNVSSEALWGDPAHILLKTILRWMPALVVVGSHGRSAAGRLILGSVSLDIVHHAPCSVRVVRVGLRKGNTPERLLIATDGSPQAMAMVDYVARRCWPEGTEVRVVSVVENLVASRPVLVPAFEGSPRASEAALHLAGSRDERESSRLRSVADESAALLQASGLDVRVAVIEGKPGSEIVAEANRWRADSIFVGERGLDALGRLLLGSVSTSVVTRAHCTVEVVRQS